MANKRVYELAKEENLTSSQLIEKLTALGVTVKNHLSLLTEEDISKYKKAGSKAETKAKPAPKPARKPAASKPTAAKKATARRTKSQTGSSVSLQDKKVTAVPKEAKKTAKAPEAPKVSVETEAAKEIVKIEEPTVEPQEQKQEVLTAPVKIRLDIPEAATVKQFAELVGRPSSEIIKTLMSLGEMVTINQPMTSEAIRILAEDYSFEPNIVSVGEEIEEGEREKPEDLLPKPPVVTIMGHVDHGKTSLLDAIRKTNVISEEAGGITQHIGAYQVVHHGKKITFIDTPGHEAFTAMRARGAKVTDVAVLVIAADDGVKPQTVEAIDHARAAHVPIVVAVNKIDKPEASPDKVRKELSELGLVPEEWGGDTVFVNISAKFQTNLEDLLEMIVLVADLLELRANPRVPASGVVIEARLDRGRGPVATALIQRGTLRVGDAVVAGLAYGRVRAMLDDRAQPQIEATPAQPVEVLGLSTVPQAGDVLKVVADERTAKQIAEERALRKRVAEYEKRPQVTLDDLFLRIKEGEIQELNIILKGDVQGSMGAIEDSLRKLEQKEVRLNIIHKAAGAISESDVMLAAASNAIIIGFNVRPTPKANEMAAKEKVDMRLYRVIYKVVEDINAALIGMLKPEYEEIELGRGEVIATFKIKGIGVIAGTMVKEGEIVRGSQARIVRDGVVVAEGAVASLRRYKEDVHSVGPGLECGVVISDFQDVKIGDVIETFELREKPRG